VTLRLVAQCLKQQRHCVRLLVNVEKYGKARQVTGENIMLRGKDALCMPDNERHSYLIRIAFPRQHKSGERAYMLS